MSERHFRSRTPRAPESMKEEIAPPPVDILIASTYDGMRATPCTERGRAFLAERYWHPADYTDQGIEIGPGQSWATFKAALRERGLRATYDYTGNHREVEA